jgi:hypothetical protein
MDRTLPNAQAVVNALLAEYQYNAKRKGLPFALTADEAKVLFQSPCHYCGVPPACVRRTKILTASFTFNGIDRVDNLCGYHAGNVVACCGVCNYAKRDMSAADFLAWVERIHSHQQGRAV